MAARRTDISRRNRRHPTPSGSILVGGDTSAGQPGRKTHRDRIVLRIELCQVLVAQGKRDEALDVCAQVDELARKSRAPEALAAAAKLRASVVAVGR